MDITPQVPDGKPLIDGYGDGGFRVGGVRYDGGVIIDGLAAHAWSVPEFQALSIENLNAITERQAEMDILLLGTGPRLLMPPKPLKLALKDHNIGLEVMDTGAACRTFNVLLTEERRVAAVLFPVP